MRKNVGGSERAARVAVGLGVMSAALLGSKSRWAYLGSVPLLTGLAGWCPVYGLLGISTRKRRRSGFGALSEAVKGRLH